VQRTLPSAKHFIATNQSKHNVAFGLCFGLLYEHICDFLKSKTGHLKSGFEWKKIQKKPKKPKKTKIRIDSG